MDEYNRFARLYDPLLSSALSPVHRAVIELLVRHGCASMADLCCGTGMLVELAERSGMTATGVDISPAMLGVARRDRPGRFVRADASALPLADDSVDGASVTFSLHEKPRRAALAILAEARRIVRPGGIVAVADYRVRPDNGPWTGRMIRLVERLAGSAHHRHFREYMDADGTDGLLAEAGMDGVCGPTFFSGWAGAYVAHMP